MADQSSIVPSESASQTQKKRNRPGKNQRQAKKTKSDTAPSVNEPAANIDLNKQTTFAYRSRSDPVPQPGKFPIVFNVGVGEPAAERHFQYDHRSLSNAIIDFDEKYVNSAKYAEFSANFGLPQQLFENEIAIAFLCGVAQQTVHAHINMGLNMGDFSSVSSTDVFQFNALRAVTQQFGEFQIPQMGDRFLLHNYQTTVSSLVRAADDIHGAPSTAPTEPLARLWLPMNANDTRTAFIIAVRLNQVVLQPLNVEIDVIVLAGAIFSAANDSFNELKPLLGNTAARQDRFDFLFDPANFATEQAWVTTYTANRATFNELDLYWRSANVTHLKWNLQTKVVFPSVLESWARRRTTIQKFFSCGSGLANKTEAKGSPAQLSVVTTVSGVTVVRSMVALSAPEYSLLACFPPSAEFLAQYDATITTTIPVRLRAIEFAQLDWIA